jgi:predicted nucleotidyltransferase
MQAIGVIVEYNPFHYGHWLHLNEAKKMSNRDKVICLMSGNFVQRGEPAICDKWRRTEMALKHGADIVIELPVYYAVSAAAYFASAGVKLLAATGLVDYICFGSECGCLEPIEQAGRLLASEPGSFTVMLKKTLKRGLSYPAARAIAFKDAMPHAPEGLFDKPNNILGIEYCKAIHSNDSQIIPLTYKRDDLIPSAGIIRKALRSGEAYDIPERASAILGEAFSANETADLHAYGDIVRYLLTRDIPISTPDMTDDLLNRFRYFAPHCRKLSDLLSEVKTKRYTFTRLQRAVLHMVLGITADGFAAFESAGGPQYIRVLGFKKESVGLLGELTRRAALPVIINPAKARPSLSPLGLRMLNKEAESSSLYALAHQSGRIRNEFSTPVIII